MTTDLTAGCPGLPYEPAPDELLAQLPPGPRALITLLNRTAPLWRTAEFAVIGRSLGAELICTSLHGDALTARAAAVPSGTSGGWRVADDVEEVTCPTAPATHRHVIVTPAVDWEAQPIIDWSQWSPAHQY